jgi:N-acetyl-gamma-glutamylphosphate reductase
LAQLVYSIDPLPTRSANISAGYVGGTILRRLVEHPRAATFEITLLVRDPLKEQKLSSLGLGLKVVVGSHADTTLLEALSSEADVVFAAVCARLYSGRTTHELFPGKR